MSLPEGYGYHLGFNDEEYKKIGVDLVKDEKNLFDIADISFSLLYLLMINYLNLKQNQSLIGVLNPYSNKQKLENLVKKINNFTLELLPRITRAQSMDILSSQANLAGYKAVVDSFANFEKAIPMMMTAMVRYQLQKF